MKVLFDPRIFNYIIMALYVLNACRWAYDRQYLQSMYWLGAFWITLSVTLMTAGGK